VSAPASFWTTLPLGRGVEVIKHDVNGLAALAKPAGVLSHPNASGDEPRSLLTVRYVSDGEFFEWPASPTVGKARLWLLNRLDSATSGVLLVAAEEALALEVRAQFKRKQVKKVYQALVFGKPPPAPQVWRDFLAVQKHGRQIRTATTGNVPSESRVSLLRLGRGEPKLALIRLEPRTGRSHQLRVQCAKRHLPIVGDQTYGDFPRNREFAKRAGTKRLFLHSLETAFDYDFKGRTFTFEARAPLPAEFEAQL
jgi:23S rRNA-/tRNA-specific pseudouridylate synthase